MDLKEVAGRTGGGGRGERETTCRSLAERTEDGFALVEPLIDRDGRSDDYRILKVNEVWERLTGLKAEDMVGKRIRESLPAVELTWPSTFAEVARTGKPKRLESYDQNSGRWYELHAFPYREGQVGVLFMDISDRIASEQRLRESEERFRAMVTTSSDVVYCMSPDWKEMRHLQGWKFLQDTEVTDDGWVGKYLHPEDRDHILDVIRKAIDGKSMFELEHRVKRVDGTWGWTLSRAVPILDRGGEIREWFGSARDITGRKAWEEALSKSEAKYRSLFESIDEGFCVIEVIFDSDGRPSDYRFLEVNPAFEEQTGIRNGVGRLMREIEPSHEDFWFETYGRIAKTGVPERFVHEAKPLMGGWFDVFAFRVGDEGSSKVAILFNDVTERKRAEEALEESEGMLEEAQRVTCTGCWSHDLARGRVSWSEELFRIFGVDKESFGNDYHSFLSNVHPEDRGLVLKANEDAREHGVPFTIEYRILTSERRERTIREIGLTEKDPSGRVVRLFGTAQDVTERKRMEDELRRSNAELQEFAYVASHDLQEPLRMVTAYLGLLEKKYGGELPDKAKEYIDYAVDGSKRMKQLMDDLLELSRVNSRPIDIAPVDMNEVARVVLDSLKLSVKEAGAAVTVELLPTVRADRGQMKQLLTNLIANAIKFRSADLSPKIEVSAITYGDEFVFSVRDNGIGIDPKFQDRMFKMFSRLHTRDEYPGTGIGLAISKKIVERHRGRIWLESEVGKGTTFFFAIPARGAPVNG